jgi:hypothetical protein
VPVLAPGQVDWAASARHVDQEQDSGCQQVTQDADKNEMKGFHLFASPAVDGGPFGSQIIIRHLTSFLYNG